ncbi:MULTISPECIES: MlaD family protein [Mycolicibacterium]|jgi:virulence factor Mce-like protein|uniref:Mammalian cell entry related domain protein n=1 Tax=Mycolicibacterium vanbaalenii (strain DSM 7251 / JCM 13017 / BCRC 16820 / KCTC 9966 / NRRL B-24157 / PYR-1) TaxID=350058 RepID=A1T3Q2_MYCVP|nr:MULTISPECIES: MlaD family protein [Mycolicibacterium]ABM11802.1 Mammalian cell entry related domain protein [Mycolicibacterium vanbaalenii PYR-1]MCV7127916.1 MCE family protein [Mycolicibacterium vanbaalenii PYR-1]QZT57775.1 MlaD family protein [Mycolicibacterium austroafricanum]WND57681.1 MlaD family protein [Mycolicibacterium vanbaalenii]
MIGSVADAVVGVARFGYRRRAWLSTAALIMTLVVASAYLFFGALQVNPLASSYRVTVELPESAGLLPNQNVTMRGVPIGRVERLDITPAGVNAVVSVDSSAAVPVASSVRVSGLSPAGEQYIDFVADSGDGPYLADGAVVSQDNTVVPVSLADLLANADGALAQADPAKLELIKRELSMSEAGPQKLADIIDGGTFLLTTLDSVLPETSSMLRTSRVVLTLAADKNAGIEVASQNLDQVFDGVNRMRQGFRTLTEQTPETLAEVDNLFADNSETMVQLLGSLTSTSQLLYLRVPALNALFPAHRTSVLDAIGSIMHDNGLWATGDIYPRYSCDYGTPRLPPSSADYPEAFMYTYCRDDHPGVLVRGAKNAPRPAGDDTAGPPAGADLGRTTDPTPKGRYTIPTPYGGPTLPIEPPR